MTTTAPDAGLRQSSCTSPPCVRLSALARRDTGLVDCGDPSSLHTNSERFRCGLPPLKPSRRWKTRSALAPRVSSSPCTEYIDAAVFIQVSYFGQPLGNAYIGPLDTGADGQYPLVQVGFAHAFTLAFTTSGTPFKIYDTTTSVFSAPFIGGTSLDGLNMNGDNGMAILAGTAATDEGSGIDTSAVTTYANTPNYGSESDIWNLDCTSGVLSPVWYNSDGNSIVPNIIYDSDSNRFVLTVDDASAYMTATSSSSAVIVTFTAVFADT